jgi:protein-disulfide isomerase
MSSSRGTKKSTHRSWKGYALAAIGLLVVAGVVGVGIAAQQGGEAASGGPAGAYDNPTDSGGELKFDMSRRIEGDPTALGAVDAPVVLIEYADFRCPFCGIYARDTMPQLIQEYVDAGVVRMEWRDLPVFGDESVAAAVAARAAGEQDLFWEFSEVVFAGAPERGHVALPRERLIEIAQEIGMPDIAAFEAGLTDPELLARVEADLAEARALGATGTPTFLVNDTPLSGAQPLSVFREVIEAELEQARN